MSDVDPSALARRIAERAASEGKGVFSDMAPAAGRTAPAGQPDGDEVLAWLAGNRMPDRRKGLQAPTGATDPHADDALSQPRPADPIEAAQKRSSVLADLHHRSPRDPRVQSVFESDPIIAEDPANGNLVTQAMLSARADVFDAVLTMLGRPVLTRAARSRLRVTLKSAFTMLSDDAQVEWALSEVRLEETKAFLEGRAQKELNTLGHQMQMIFDRSDLWAAGRAFSMAAHLAVGRDEGSASLAELLEMREID